VTIEGFVKERVTGNPIPHAKLLILRSYVVGRSIQYERTLHEADSNGYFSLELPWSSSYTVYAYYDDASTPGFDYVPFSLQIQAPLSERLNLTFELWEGASFFLDGEVLLVETTKTPTSSYALLDPDSGKPLQDEYYPEGQDLLGLGRNHFVVRAGVPFVVRVNSEVEVEGKRITLSFLVDKPGHFLLGKGGVARADLVEFSLPLSLSKVREESAEVGTLIEEKEHEGFYLAVERQRFAQITSLILTAENLLSQGIYNTSFTRLREAYVEISNLRNWLNAMYQEALVSVFFLILFLAFTAVTASHLLFEENAYKIGGSLAFFVAFLSTFYLLYPGSRLVQASLFLGASVVSFVAVLCSAAWAPRFLKGRGVKGYVSLRNLVVPIFSIAKRSLRRRRLRSVLTFLSVTTLVSSFIALTSFSVGFGLTFSQVASRPSPSTGILVRSPDPQVTETTNAEELLFSPLDNSSIEWFRMQPEARLVAPKYENQPHPASLVFLPLDYVGRVPIFGVIGIVPSAEARILPWNETIVEGRFLSDEDEGAVLISASLKERLNTSVGATLTLSGLRLQLRIVGIFDDVKVESLRDLDGQVLLPKKMVVTDTIPTVSGQSIPVWSLTPCSADETLVVMWRTISKVQGVDISRINVALKVGEDLKEYAKEMALNKGFRAWASAEDGLYLAQLASYFEGKGLPLAVPWGIVVLNVVITMLNSLYERKKEINIYSSIGMSPSHVSALFLVEAAMIGVIGGGVGYLLGLGWYKAMAFFTLALQVKQKVSAIWVLAATAISLAAVLAGGFLALRWSVVITPSLRRRWRIEEGPSPWAQPEILLPTRISEAEVDGFIGFLVERLRSHTNDSYFETSQIKAGAEEGEGMSTRTVEFRYRSTSRPFGSYSMNTILLRRERGGGEYSVNLSTSGDQEGMLRAGYLTRRILMEWSVERGKRSKT
jgi:ABC-type lipoprotein release transport system permease subunit